jgi:hypothetical protein
MNKSSAAKRAGLRARKARWRANSLDNLGGYMLVHLDSNWVADGPRFDLSAEDASRCTAGMRRKVHIIRSPSRMLCSIPIINAGADAAFGNSFSGPLRKTPAA